MTSKLDLPQFTKGMLYEANLTIGANGNDIPIDERHQEIHDQYGEDSEKHRIAGELAAYFQKPWQDEKDDFARENRAQTKKQRPLTKIN